jgi:hypothetical protein
MCHVYLSLNGEDAIVASMYNHGGLFAEKPDGVRHADASDLEALGRCVIECMNACESKKKFNYSKHKKSDWPAYKHSGFKTMRAFEKEYSNYCVRGANDANIIWIVSSQDLPGGFNIQSTIGQIHDTSIVGDKIVKMNVYFQKIRDIT